MDLYYDPVEGYVLQEEPYENRDELIDTVLYATTEMVNPTEMVVDTPHVGLSIIPAGAEVLTMDQTSLLGDLDIDRSMVDHLTDLGTLGLVIDDGGVRPWAIPQAGEDYWFAVKDGVPYLWYGWYERSDDDVYHLFLYQDDHGLWMPSLIDGEGPFPVRGAVKMEMFDFKGDAIDYMLNHVPRPVTRGRRGA